MTLYERIMVLCPSLTIYEFTDTIRLQNDCDGSGDYIASWKHPTVVRPTEEQLEQVVLVQPLASL